MDNGMACENRLVKAEHMKDNPLVAAMNKRIKTGVVLIILGICILMAVLPFSSVYDKKENIMWNVMRSFVTGEIILKKVSLNIFQTEMNIYIESLLNISLNIQNFRASPKKS